MSESKRPMPVGVWHEVKQDAAPDPAPETAPPRATDEQPEQLSPAQPEQAPDAQPSGEQAPPVPDAPPAEPGTEKQGELLQPAQTDIPDPPSAGESEPPEGIEPLSPVQATAVRPDRTRLRRAVSRAERAGEKRAELARMIRIAFAVAAVGLLIAIIARRMDRPDPQPVRQDSSSAAPASVSLPQTVEEDPLSPADPELWSLMLANTQNPLPDGYKPELADTGNGQKVDARILEPLQEMIRAAQEDGIYLYVRSAYRSEETQRVLFDQLQSEYMSMGYSEQEAYALAKKLRNLPGTSEHQTGLAVDLVSAAAPGVNLVASLSETDWAKWLAENAADYGFILRYPEDKTDITGTSFEPWHYRYVGVEDARKIMDAGLCLEEYLGAVPEEALPAVTDTSEAPSGVADSAK